MSLPRPGHLGQHEGADEVGDDDDEDAQDEVRVDVGAAPTHDGHEEVQEEEHQVEVVEQGQHQEGVQQRGAW